jgi:hypothetical protein
MGLIEGSFDVKKSPRLSREGGEKYYSIFEHSAVSLWEEDISRLRSRLRELKTGNVSLRAYLAEHPEFVQEAVELIEVTDVNAVSLKLFEADRKEQLLGPLSVVLGAVSRGLSGLSCHWRASCPDRVRWPQAAREAVFVADSRPRSSARGRKPERFHVRV